MRKIGFSAYAISADINDPMVKAVYGLIDHAASVDERLNWIVAQLRREHPVVNGEQSQEPQPDKFDPEYLNKIVD